MDFTSLIGTRARNEPIFRGSILPKLAQVLLIGMYQHQISWVLWIWDLGQFWVLEIWDLGGFGFCGIWMVWVLVSFGDLGFGPSY